MSRRKIFGFEPVHPEAFEYALRSKSDADYYELMHNAERITYTQARAKMMGLDEYISARCLTFGEDTIVCAGPMDFVFCLSRLNGKRCYFADHDGDMHIWLKSPQQITGVMSV